jgi:hypothetical protein
MCKTELQTMCAYQVGNLMVQRQREQAVVPRGCLLRRVNVDTLAGESFEDPLLMAGYRADRPSVWGLQVCSLFWTSGEILHDLQ